MIKPEPEGSTQGYPLVSVEVLRSTLTDSQVTPTKPGRMTKPKPYSSHRFIANCFNAGHLKMEVKAQGQEHVSGVAIREPVAEATRPLPVVEGKGNAIATDEQAAQSLLALHTPKRRNAEIGANADKVISEGNTEILNFGEVQGEDVDNKVYLEEKTVKLDEAKARSDHGKTPESQPAPEPVLIEEDQAGPYPRKSHVALAGPNPEPMHNEFVSTIKQTGMSSLPKKTSLKRERHDDQDPPPTPNLDLSKKKRHDSGTSRSKQHPAPQSLVWKMFDTREAPSSSSKQQSTLYSNKPVEDVPIPDDVNISDSEVIDTAHLPKIKTSPDWLKLTPMEDRPES
nr:hypothetical protein [Tanacetum cinerariifolium]